MTLKVEVLKLSIIVTAIFVVLKVTNVIDWSWWWVLSPLLIATGLIILFLIITFLILSIALIFSEENPWNDER